MLQAEDKEGLLDLLKNSKNEPVPPIVKEKFYEPKTVFSSDKLPESPHKRMLESIETMSNEYINSMLNDKDSSISRFQKVSSSFITGAIILINLPSRDNLVLYNKQLIKGLRYIFDAYSKNSFFNSRGSRYDACTLDSVPGINEHQRKVFLSVVLTEIPVTFYPRGYGFTPKELLSDNWSQGILDGWKMALEHNAWDSFISEKSFGKALEAEIMIMSLYVGACLLKKVKGEEGGVHGASLLFGKCHELMCGLSYLLGIERRIMPGPLSSGKYRLNAVPVKVSSPPTLFLALNPDFLVRLQIDMSILLAWDEANFPEALQTIHMCQTFQSRIWDGESRYFRGQFLKIDQKFKESYEEFEKCLVKSSNNSTLAAACYREMALLLASGTKSRFFTVGEVQRLIEEADGLSKGEEFIWFNGSNDTADQLDILKSELIKQVLPGETKISKIKFINDKGKWVLKPLQILQENGPVCASCSLCLSFMMRCSRCKNPNYFVCGTDCQKKDWESHKIDCLKK